MLSLQCTYIWSLVYNVLLETSNNRTTEYGHLQGYGHYDLVTDLPTTFGIELIFEGKDLLQAVCELLAWPRALPLLPNTYP